MTARRRARHDLIPRHDCPTRHEARLHPRSSQRTPLRANAGLTRRTWVQRGLDTSARARSEWGKQRETEDGAGQLATYTKPMPSQTLHTREPLPLQTKHLLFPPIAMSKLPQPAPSSPSQACSSCVLCVCVCMGAGGMVLQCFGRFAGSYPEPWQASHLRTPLSQNTHSCM
jgi:hypothetical protein